MITTTKIENSPKKTPLKKFLAQNPFPYPNTLGFFYREKMRAIHRIAPDLYFDKILEIGGGRGGLTALLYSSSHITNLDCNPKFADANCNRQENVTFICGDATALPFADSSFAAVTMFDVLEHIQDDRKAMSEALRVLKPGGFLFLSTPNENWRFPYYGFMRSLCPPESKIMAEWGHVRRGYTLEELNDLVGFSCQQYATFINSFTVLCHDVAFSNLAESKKRIINKLISPFTWLGYYLHRSQNEGTETVHLWQI